MSVPAFFSFSLCPTEYFIWFLMSRSAFIPVRWWWPLSGNLWLRIAHLRGFSYGAACDYSVYPQGQPGPARGWTVPGV